MTRYLFDTSVLLAGLMGTSKRSERYYDDDTVEKVTIEYVLKESYRVLRDFFKLNEDEINHAMEDIHEKIRILPNPTVGEFRKINISDKSDRPIVCAAKKYGCTLLLRDYRTYKESQDIVDVEYIPKNE